MSGITEILGEKKFNKSQNVDIGSRLILEDTRKISYDNNLFLDISQQQQFIDEKNSCTKFRIYGKVNPILNLKPYRKLINSLDSLQEINTNFFDFDLSNWSMVILKSKRIDTGVIKNGQPMYSKGLKNIFKKDVLGNFVFDLDFKRGLPARYYYSETNTDNFSIFMPLSHNLEIGDRVRIDTNDSNFISSGFYDIIDISGDIIYLDIPNPIDYLNSSEFSGKYVQKINNLFFTQAELNQIVSTNRPNVNSFIKPDFYVSKILDKEILEYYIKVLEVVSVVDNLDNCGFSKNHLSQQIKTFSSNTDVNILNLVDNLNYPINDLYFGFIKKTPTASGILGDIESHFPNYIESISDGNGLELISSKNPINSKTIKIGDIFYHSVCEHSTENLYEKEILEINHKFLYKDILFRYKPFYKIQIKLKSPYIEDADNTERVPVYSIYSRQRDKYIWRDVFDIGFFDEDGRVIDFPFTNGVFYVYKDINFVLSPEKNFSRKYQLKVNDVTSLIGDDFENIFSDVFDILNTDEQIDSEQVGDVKPYIEYKEEKC